MTVGVTNANQIFGLAIAGDDWWIKEIGALDYKKCGINCSWYYNVLLQLTNQETEVSYMNSDLIEKITCVCDLN